MYAALMTSHEAEVGLWMVLIGADGEITDEELAAMSEAARVRFGDRLAVGEVSVLATQAQQRIERIGARAYLHELVHDLPRSSPQAVLDTAMSIARADSLAPEERDLLRFVARELGLPETL
jgi:tellurite resistance protein